MSKRTDSLLPGGIPKYVRIYDNGGETFDRYTAVFTGKYPKNDRHFLYVGMSERPFHPQGFGQHGESQTQIDVNKWGFAPMIGRKNHLGKRIPYSELPSDCQILVLRDYVYLWNLKNIQIPRAKVF